MRNFVQNVLIAVRHNRNTVCRNAAIKFYENSLNVNSITRKKQLTLTVSVKMFLRSDAQAETELQSVPCNDTVQ